MISGYKLYMSGPDSGLGGSYNYSTSVRLQFDRLMTIRRPTSLLLCCIAA